MDEVRHLLQSGRFSSVLHVTANILEPPGDLLNQMTNVESWVVEARAYALFRSGRFKECHQLLQKSSKWTDRVNSVTALMEIARKTSNRIALGGTIVSSYAALSKDTPEGSASFQETLQFNSALSLACSGQLDQAILLLETFAKSILLIQRPVVQRKRQRVLSPHDGEFLQSKSDAVILAVALVDHFDDDEEQMRRYYGVRMLLAALYAAREELDAAKVLFDSCVPCEQYRDWMEQMSEMRGLVSSGPKGVRNATTAGQSFKMGDFQGCLQALGGIDSLEAHQLAGCALLCLNQPEESVARFKAALSIASIKGSVSIALLSNTYLALAKAQRPIEQLVEVLGLLAKVSTEQGTPDQQADAWLRFGVALMKQGRFADAVPHLTKSRDLGRVGARKLEVSCLMTLQRFREALSLMERFSDVGDVLQRMECMLRLGLMNELADFALKIKTDDADALTLNNVAMMYLMINRPFEACGLFRRARSLDSSSEGIALNFVMCLLLLDRVPEAITEWTQFRGLDLSKQASVKPSSVSSEVSNQVILGNPSKADLELMDAEIIGQAKAKGHLSWEINRVLTMF